MSVFQHHADRMEFLAPVDDELSSVVFVRSYVQLLFRDARITAVTQPSVTAHGQTLGWGMPGYRDLLCGQIGKLVTRCFVLPDVRLQIDFADGSKIEVDLRPGAYRAAEAVILETLGQYETAIV